MNAVVNLVETEVDMTTGYLVEVPTGANPREAGGKKQFQFFSPQDLELITQNDTYDRFVTTFANGHAKALSLGITNFAKVEWNDFLQLKKARRPLSVPAASIENVRTIVPNIPKSEFSVMERYGMFESMVEMVANKTLRGLVCIGNKGMSKSSTVHKILQACGMKNKLENDGEGNYTVMKGSASGPGFYKTLYDNKDGLIILDDCELTDTRSIEYLKAISDTGERRFVTSEVIRRAGYELPNFFEFTGQVIIISNASESEVREALGERLPTLNMWMNPAEIVEFIETVIVPTLGNYPASAVNNALDLILDRKAALPEFNLRTFTLVLNMAMSGNPDWKNLCKFTVLRGSQT